MKCDLIVVGAGPAGSMAAKTSAEKGLDVVLLEKRQEIGDPVRCGELVYKEALSKLITADPSWIAAEVKDTKIYAPDGTGLSLSSSQPSHHSCYVLNRKVFDRHLATEAARAGASIMVKTRALGILVKDCRPCGIQVLHHGERMEIKAPLIIGADGIESKVGRWAGIDTVLKPEDLGTCIQFLVQDNTIDEDCCKFFIGNKIAPGGYAWCFPKGGTTANVGLGIQGSLSKPGKPLNLLKMLVNELMPRASILEIVSGGVPCSGPLKTCVADGVMLVGDAARQSDPLIGAGIISGMIAGVMAGEVAANSVLKEDTSAIALKTYEERWQQKMGMYASKNYELKRILTKMTDNDLNDIFHALNKEHVSSMGLINVLKIVALSAQFASILS
jgi:digeranylgeranylglycerophospholipid reductase